jgi:hypothetical protein
MMVNPQELMYKDRALAARLELGAPMNMQFFLNDDSPDV